ncbi:centlein isoform X2 [Brachyhypopomus gauderio]|uniref:centlein isoform X2 n=1 Tax=Brachyhypopomus gauderio TaxID=698409 RepID=UPI004043850E
MASKEKERVVLLEGEVRSLREELVQCQADKEFVWSLWKRLQVASPDLTQAVSLVVEREKQKAEAKDRKVLEILQAKDLKIQTLEQEVASQRMMLGDLTQKQRGGEEEHGVMKKELAGLRHKLSNQTRQLQVRTEELEGREEEWGRVRGALEEARHVLEERCSGLEEARRVLEERCSGLEEARRVLEERCSGLEEARRVLEERCSGLEEARRVLEERCSGLEGALHQAQEQNEECRKKETLSTTRVKELQVEVVKSRAELLEAQGRCAALSAQLTVVEQLASDREQQLQQISRELQELQGLYSQSVQHAGEQAELIQQLEGLNLDTQQALHSQEQKHSTQTTSYQQLYTELSMSYQALRCSEENLRQRDTFLSEQLHQRSQHISQLQTELQWLRGRAWQAEAPPPPPQLFEVPRPAGAAEQQCGGGPAQQAPSPVSVPQTEDAAVGRESGAQPLSSSTTQGPGGARHSQQDSRSLSPVSKGGAERRIQQLEELLALKTEENEELRRAHAQRHDRLRLIQTNYKAMKEQLRQVEDLQGMRRRGRRRVEPCQLRQENSDAVWNELAFFKRENKKLLAEKAHLEEEMDIVRVQAAMDRTTAHELHMCLQEERQELREDEEEQVTKASALIQPSARRLEQSVQKIEVLERRMVCLERETAKLREANQALQEANSLLSQDRDDLQSALKRAKAREEAAQARATAERERLLGEAQALEAQVQSSRREAGVALGAQTQSRRTLLRLRQELGVLRAERDFHRALSRRWGKTPLASSRARLPATRPIQTHTRSERRPTHTRSDQRPTHTRSEQRPTHTRSEQRRTHSPTKDEWEDVSPDSESEDFSDSLESWPPAQNRHNSFKLKGCRHALITPRDARASVAAPPLSSAPPGPVRQGLRKRRRMKSQHSCARLRQRLLCLQQQVAVLQSASRAAQEQSERHCQAQTELESLMHKLQASKQLSQKQACELVKLQQQVTLLEVELEQWRKPRPPTQEHHPPATPPAPDSNHPSLKILEEDIKQLTSRLKSASVEGSRQSAVIKDLRAELHNRDHRLKELQDKVSHTERDVVMKRQLVVDLRNRLKVLQDSEHSHRSLTDDLEKKVKSLAEEAANRKAFIDSLKRRLSVATEEKNQHESTCKKLQEDLQKKDEKLGALQARLGECERSRVEEEQAACAQVQVLTQQSSDALQALQNKLSLVQAQEQQLRSLTQALAVEVARDVQETREQVKRRKKEKKKDRTMSTVSKRSMRKATSIAASILNLTEVDLANMLDTDEEEVCGEGADQDWMDQVTQLLQQQVPSAGLLLEAVLVKMKEWRVLTEELVLLSTTVRENA